VKKGQRTHLTIELTLLFLRMASLLVPRFLTQRVSGLPDNQPGSSHLTTSKGNDQGGVSGPARGTAGASTLAFTHDLDGVHSLGASGSRDDCSKIVGDQPGSEATGAGLGSTNQAGAGDVGPLGRWANRTPYSLDERGCAARSWVLRATNSCLLFQLRWPASESKFALHSVATSLGI
jgi:hypothetical protein